MHTEFKLWAPISFSQILCSLRDGSCIAKAQVTISRGAGEQFCTLRVHLQRVHVTGFDDFQPRTLVVPPFSVVDEARASHYVVNTLYLSLCSTGRRSCLLATLLPNPTAVRRQNQGANAPLIWAESMFLPLVLWRRGIPVSCASLHHPS